MQRRRNLLIVETLAFYSINLSSMENDSGDMNQTIIINWSFVKDNFWKQLS